MHWAGSERGASAWQGWGARLRVAAVAGIALVSACGQGSQASSPEPRDGDQDEPGNDDPDRDDAVKRAAWLKAYYGGDPATSEYLEFKRQAAALTATRWADTLSTAVPFAGPTGPTWNNLGPFRGTIVGNELGQDDSMQGSHSGRLRAIVTHPTNAQIVYIATAGGGVFKTTNADLNATTDWTWTPMTDSLPASSAGGNLSTGDLAMSPSDPETLFLGMGDPVGADFGGGTGASKGFFITHDGGVTWTAGGGMGQVIATWKILPLDANTLLVGTNQGLWRSADGGATFTQINVAGANDPVGTNVYSIETFANGTVVCARRNTTDGTSGQIYFSINAGMSWTRATVTGPPLNSGTMGRVTLARAPSTPATAYALVDAGNAKFDPGLLKTTDSGHTWTYIAPTQGGADDGFGSLNINSQSQYNQLLTVDPGNPNTIFSGAVALVRSSDGGLTWGEFPTLHNDNHAAAWSKTGPKTLFVGNDGGLAVVRDPSRTPIPDIASAENDLTFLDLRRNRGLATHLIYYISSTPATTPADSPSRIAIGMQDNGVYLRENAGSGLAQSGKFDLWLGGDGFGTLYHPQNGNLVLGVFNGQLTRAADGGPNFSFITAPLTFAAPLVLGAGDPTGNTVYSLATSAVLKSTDFGNTWTTLPTTGLGSNAFLFHVAASKSNPQVLATVGTGAWISVNGGTSWTAMGSLAPTAVPRGVWFDPTNANVIYVSGVGFDATIPHLWKSTDQGKTFKGIDGSATQSNGLTFGLPVYAVRIDPTNPNNVYAGTDLGVYASADGGSTWSRLGVGMPLIAARDFYLSDDGRLLRVGTYGRGVWEIQIPTSTGTPPAAPTGLTATAGDKQVTLSWMPSTGATSYAVARSTTSGSGFVTIAPALTTTSFVDMGLTDGTTYFYVVTASNASGTSPNSAQVSATPMAVCTPETDAAFCAALAKNCGTVTGNDNCGTSRTVTSCGTCTAPQTCGGAGTPNVCGTASTDPCAGLCANPTVFTGPNSQSGNLGTSAVCRETTATLHGGNCSNMSGRTVTVNGVTESCNGWTIPPARNGGYCVQVTAGTPDFASFATW